MPDNAPVLNPPGKDTLPCAPRHILVRGVNWLGDAVMTTPALLRLRERFPQARITLLGPEKLRDLWLQHPGVDHLLTLAPGENPWAVARKLRRENFALALVLPNSPRSALEAWLARIPQRIGYARSWRNWFLTQAVPSRPGRVPMRKRSPREVQRLIHCPSPTADHEPPGSPCSSPHHLHEYLHLVATLGANPAPLPPRLEVSATELAAARAAYLPGPQPAAPSHPSASPPLLLGLNPGAEYGPAKRWPADNFAAVAAAVSQQLGHCSWLIFGGPNDRPLCDQVAQRLGARAINLAGKTSLRELMALLKLCRVLLTNDTGPMHVAAALGTPVVVPFGSTSPELTGPGLPGDPRHQLLKSTVSCSPCFLRECPIDFRCMHSITVEHATQALLSSLKPH